MLGLLNNDSKFDISTCLNNFYGNDAYSNPYLTKGIITKYTDIEGFINNPALIDRDLFISINICSLNSKFSDLKDIILRLNLSGLNVVAIALQEIWQVQYPDLLKINGYKLFFKQRNNGRGGGVGFYIKEGLPAKINNNLSNFHEKIFECLTVEITLNNKSYTLVNIYRSPSNLSNHVDSFLNYLDITLNQMNKNNSPYFIFSDSNLNLLKIEQCPHSQKYLEVIHSNGFLQYIGKATRIQGVHLSLIDHICCKNEPGDLTPGTIVSDLSDHFLNFISVASGKKNVKQKYITSRKFDKNNMKQFRDALESVSWNNVLVQDNVDMAYDQFWETFSSLFEIYIPEVKTKFNKNIHRINGHLTKGLLISRNQKNFLHKQYIKTPNHINELRYKNYRNIYNTLLRKSKKLHISRSLSDNKHNPKKTWEILNNIIGCNKSASKVTELNINGQTICDSKIIAEEFNNFFTGVGQRISDSIDRVSIEPESYLDEANNLPSFEFDEIGPILICDILKSFESKKSVDIDGINTNLLKYLNTTISTPLAHIFNLSLKNGKFPSNLKKSRVVPIFKAGDPKNCDNYRPISLVSAISKILEKIVAIKLTNYLDINKLIYNKQFGFQRSLSTEHNLLHLTNFVSKAINDDEYCIGIFLDLKKAFDVVNHKILLKKLKNLGLKGTSLLWFESYLEGRSQFFGY